MQLFPLWLAHEMFTGWNDTLLGAIIDAMGGYTAAMVFQVLIVLAYLVPEHVDVRLQTNTEGDAK
ncbi:hypothetical protein [Halorarum salinum]|uniref:Uncharacterized protein n=1 Tax=Halorarum salinum TaxID=2743089 RepID=A0A7D5Q9U2_9EURY|nr:hypothetical protein [Halobaculum salinum]QLG61996.1 hypothetical protein HUG12_09785 [Halobaculum salinum]